MPKHTRTNSHPHSHSFLLVALGLSLWKNAILSAGAQYLAEGLTRNRSLQWLGLGGNKIGPDGMCAQLQSGLGLASSSNSTAHFVCVCVCASLLLLLLLFSRPLSFFSLSLSLPLFSRPLTLAPPNFSVASTGALSFAQQLGHMHLHWLGIGGNSLTDQGAIYLASALKGLSGFICFAPHARALLHAVLACNTWLTHGLCCCLLCCALLGCADDGCDLQSLGLGGNGITDQGAEKFARALWTNTRLESLGLGGNEISQ